MEMAYMTPDIAVARGEVIKVLNDKAGETILDIGSGPGFLARDLANCVDPAGSTYGIDLAENMVEAGRKLCADLPWAEFRSGDAMSLPYPNASFDASLRVRAGFGRNTFRIRSSNAPRWQRRNCGLSATDTTIRGRIIDAWSDHCAQATVRLRLSGAIRSANIEIKCITPLPLFICKYVESTFSYWVSKNIGAFVLDRKGIGQSDIDAWHSGLEQLGEKGDYFFCINRYLFEVTK